jgi:hypothetical protein
MNDNDSQREEYMSNIGASRPKNGIITWFYALNNPSHLTSTLSAEKREFLE